jgi:hypothetical protein
MPSQQGVRGNDRGDFGKHLPSQTLGIGRQSATLIVTQSKSLVAELLAKNAILFPHAVNHLQLALVHPAGDGDQQEPEWV